MISCTSIHSKSCEICNSHEVLSRALMQQMLQNCWSVIYFSASSGMNYLFVLTCFISCYHALSEKSIFKKIVKLLPVIKSHLRSSGFPCGGLFMWWMKRCGARALTSHRISSAFCLADVPVLECCLVSRHFDGFTLMKLKQKILLTRVVMNSCNS